VLGVKVGDLIEEMLWSDIGVLRCCGAGAIVGCAVGGWRWVKGVRGRRWSCSCRETARNLEGVAFLRTLASLYSVP
jgi:hypothetical protein